MTINESDLDLTFDSKTGVIPLFTFFFTVEATYQQ